MKALLSFFLLALLIISCDSDNDQTPGPRITGSGNIISESRTTGSFENVRISSVVVANVVYGTTQEIVVQADDNIIGLVRTYTSGSTLNVDLESGNYNDVSIEVTITIPEITRLTSSGVNAITLSGFNQLDVLDVNLLGVGSITMDGAADFLRIDSSGAGNFFGFDFEANTAEINLTGVGNVEITAIDELAGTLSGVGNILYRGNPAVSVSVSGVGSVVDSN